MELTDKHRKVIYNAVRRYQISVVAATSDEFLICDEIMKNIFSEIKDNYVEPAYEVNTND
jgi:hypothetical protein